MPASVSNSLFPMDMESLLGSTATSTTSTSSGTRSSVGIDDSRTMHLALELARLQTANGGGGGAFEGFSSSSSSSAGDGHHHGLLGVSVSAGGHAHHHNHHHMGMGMSGSLEDLKMTRRSQNMTECVPVPTSEHVAEIVGRQGCKIKALRAKTNTYIKTPVRGEEPVFVVTGRKEDVALAKREILSAAEHFSQIRASRSKNINSTLAFGQLVANQPGQTTTQVRVPYRVVGLVVGPKGATIKRIQQQTHTYIVTPSRDKEPVFEVTGLPENVEAAKKEIEAHIAIRTGADITGSGSSGGSGFGFGRGDDFGFGSFSSSNGHLDALGGGANNKLSSLLNKGVTLQSLLDGGQDSTGGIMTAWSNNGGTDSHDSGIGHSPPFDKGIESSGIWGELNRMLGGLDLSAPVASSSVASAASSCGSSHEAKSSFLSVGSRSSLDLGTLGRANNGNGLLLDRFNTASFESSGSLDEPASKAASDLAAFALSLGEAARDEDRGSGGGSGLMAPFATASAFAKSQFLSFAN